MPTLGQFIAILSGITGFISIMVGAYRLGGVSERQNSTERNLGAALLDFREQLAKVSAHIEGNQLVRSEWSGWRATTENRLENIETEQGRFAKNTHGLRDTLQAHETRITVLERKEDA